MKKNEIAEIEVESSEPSRYEKLADLRSAVDLRGANAKVLVDLIDLLVDRPQAINPVESEDVN